MDSSISEQCFDFNTAAWYMKQGHIVTRNGLWGYAYRANGIHYNFVSINLESKVSSPYAFNADEVYANDWRIYYD